MLRIKLLFALVFLFHFSNAQTWNKLIENPFNFGGAQSYGIRIIDDTVYVSSVFVYTDSVSNNRAVISKHSIDTGELIEAVPFWNENYQNSMFNDLYGGFNQLYDTPDEKFYMSYTPFDDDNGVETVEETELLRINRNLEVESTVIVNGFENDQMHYLQGTRLDNDGNILCYGFRTGDAILNGDSAHTWLAKMTSDGDQLWSKNYDDSYIINALCPMSDGDIVFNAGEIGESYMHRKYLIKTNADGEEMWRRQYGGMNTSYLAMICESFDNDIIVGNSWNVSTNPGDGGVGWWYTRWIEISEIKDLGTSYEIETQKYFDATNQVQEVYGIEKYGDSNYVVWGTTNSQAGATDDEFGNPSLPYVRGYILVLDENLDSVWMRTYYMDDTDPLQCWSEYRIADLATVESGGFVTTGWGKVHALDDLYQVWLMRLDEYGCIEPGCQNVHVNEVVIGLENTMTVFPNPVVDHCTIAFNVPNTDSHQTDLNDTELVLIDIHGRELQRISMPNFGSHYQVTLDLQSLPTGTYQAHWIKNNSWLDSVQIIKV